MGEKQRYAHTFCEHDSAVTYIKDYTADLPLIGLVSHELQPMTATVASTATMAAETAT